MTLIKNNNQSKVFSSDYIIKTTVKYFTKESCNDIIKQSLLFLQQKNLFFEDNKVIFYFSDDFINAVNSVLIDKNYTSSTSNGIFIDSRIHQTINNKNYIIININQNTFNRNTLISIIIHELVHCIDYKNYQDSINDKLFFGYFSEYRAKYYQECYYIENKQNHTNISEHINNRNSAYNIVLKILSTKSKPKDNNYFLYNIFHAIGEIKAQEVFNIPNTSPKKIEFKQLLNNFFLDYNSPKRKDSQLFISIVNRLINYGTVLPINFLKYL